MTRTRASAYKTNNLLFTLGCDFTFRDADKFFSNISLIRDYINSRPLECGNLRIQYSLLSEYFEKITQENKNWPIYSEKDFFPYSDSQIIIILRKQCILDRLFF
jgi:lysosomal alpha-mannosidase